MIISLVLMTLLGRAPALQTSQTAPSTQQQKPVEPAVKRYQSSELNLIFDYPTTWRNIPQKTKNRGLFKKNPPPTKTVLNVPVTGGSAELELYAVQYFGDKEMWQIVQVDVNKQLSRDVKRQWQEEILGVPLLMTRVDYQEKGESHSVLTGLLYSRWPRKLVFRLDCKSDLLEASESEFRSALQSLRTIDGDLPKPEDPNRQLTAEDLNPKAKPQLTRTLKMQEEERHQEIVKGEQATELAIGAQKYQLRYPKGWSGTVDKDGSVVMKSDAVHEMVRIEIRQTSDAIDPLVAYQKSLAANLDMFDKVTARREVVNQMSRAGMTLNSVFRFGVSGASDVSSSYAIGLNGAYGWLGKIAIKGKLSPGEVAALEELWQGMSLEAAP